jgi:hypothetical protein
MKINFKNIKQILVLLLVYSTTQAQNTVISGNMSVFGPFGATNFSQNTYLGGSTGPELLITGTNGDFRQAGENFAIIKTGSSLSSTIHITDGGRLIFDKPADYAIGSTALSWTTQNFDGGVNFSNPYVADPYYDIYGDGTLLNRNPNNVNLKAIDVTPAGFVADNYNDVYFIIGKTEFALTDGAGNAITGNDFILNNQNYVHYPSGTPNVIQNYRESRFFVTNGSGHLGILMGDPVTAPGYNSQTFPVGIAEGDYTPAELSITSGTFLDFNMVNVKTYANPETAEDVPAEGIDRVWNINRNNFPASLFTAPTINVNLQHNDVTNGSLYTYPNAFVTRYSGTAPNTDGGATSYTQWDYTGTCIAESDNGTLTTDVTMSTATELSRDFTTFATSPSNNIAWYTKSVCDASPLPVELLSFTGQTKDCKVYLKWKTATEVNFNHFEVERSLASGSFEKIESVLAKGSGSNYTIVDNEIVKNASYRLKMIDNDGTVAYSSSVQITQSCDRSSVISLYPNPFTNIFTISSTERDIVGTELKIYAVDGKSILTKKIESSFENIDMSTFATGIYYVEINDIKYKIVKQ